MKTTVLYKVNFYFFVGCGNIFYSSIEMTGRDYKIGIFRSTSLLKILGTISCKCIHRYARFKQPAIYITLLNQFYLYLD